MLKQECWGAGGTALNREKNFRNVQCGPPRALQGRKKGSLVPAFREKAWENSRPFFPCLALATLSILTVLLVVWLELSACIQHRLSCCCYSFQVHLGEAEGEIILSTKPACFTVRVMKKRGCTSACPKPGARYSHQG